MYLPISRLYCLLLAILASHCLVAFGTDLLGEKSQELIAPMQVTHPNSPMHEASEPAEAGVKQLSSDSGPNVVTRGQFESLEGGENSRKCVDLDGSFAGGQYESYGNSESSFQHLAPEVVLRFSSGCADSEFVDWKLSSRDTPRAQPAIPHGPLAVELLVDKPIDFVELMFDGKPLKPTSYTNAGPLSYSLPCPAPGQHWLQARYLSGNIWSLYSNPIRFEVRLPPQPRIIAASDVDRDPTPLPRNSMTSITTHSIKVHLADVNRGDNIVAYIDGKPLPPHCHAFADGYPIPVESNNQLCCRVFRVAGAVIPGVHKLTVRVVGCSDECSITSQPSNAIAFHYYDEDIYLLRPGAGCNNGRPGQACSPTLDSTSVTPATKRSMPLVLIPTESSVTGPEHVVRIISQPVPSLDEGRYTVGRAQAFRFVSFLQATSSKRADDMYLATKKLLDETLVDERVELHRSEESVKASKNLVANAESHFRRAQGHLKDAALEMKRAQDSAMTANNESARANTFAAAEATCGDEARARVAGERSNLAAHNAQLANEQVALAAKNYDQVMAVVSHAKLALKEAGSHSASANSMLELAQKEANNLDAARIALNDAAEEARKAYNREFTFRKQNQEDHANTALEELESHKGIAEQRSKDVFIHAERIKQYADWAADRERNARDEAQRANEAANLAHSYTDLIRKSAIRTEQLTADTARSAQLAGRVIEEDVETHRAWDEAEEKAAYDAAVKRLFAANAGNDENGVRRAREYAKAAETLASHEWNKAASRIAEGEANAIRSRAEKVIGPSSPFFFAAAAHFPIREFGLRGEAVEREGIVFYEDMKFAFDQHGNYQVHFRASAPKMPATVRLQFQIQPHRNGPWYTITLAPIEFPYPTVNSDKTNCSGSNCGGNCSNCSDESKNCCGEARECVCKGHSEILRRCYGEMGQDARIRRSGTARFGFGVNVPN